MASVPSFDPNLLASHDPTEVTDNYERAAQGPRRPAAQPMRPSRSTRPGRCSRSWCPPPRSRAASTRPTPKIPGPAVLDLPDTQRRSATTTTLRASAAQLTLDQALAISCNTAFAKIGIDLGDDALREQAEAFGFNQPLEHPPAGRPPASIPPTSTPRRPRQSAIGQYDVEGHGHCRWPWSGPASPTTAW